MAGWLGATATTASLATGLLIVAVTLTRLLHIVTVNALYVGAACAWERRDTWQLCVCGHMAVWLCVWTHGSVAVCVVTWQLGSVCGLPTHQLHRVHSKVCWLDRSSHWMVLWYCCILLLSHSHSCSTRPCD